jgi:hypothetical protein
MVFNRPIVYYMPYTTMLLILLSFKHQESAHAVYSLFSVHAPVAVAMGTCAYLTHLACLRAKAQMQYRPGHTCHLLVY